MTPADTITITLRPTPGCVDPTRALRALLKTALRQHGLKCIGLTTTKDPRDEQESGPAA